MRVVLWSVGRLYYGVCRSSVNEEFKHSILSMRNSLLKLLIVSVVSGLLGTWVRDSNCDAVSGWHSHLIYGLCCWQGVKGLYHSKGQRSYSYNIFGKGSDLAYVMSVNYRMLSVVSVWSILLQTVFNPVSILTTMSCLPLSVTWLFPFPFQSFFPSGHQGKMSWFLTNSLLPLFSLSLTMS